MMALIHQKVFFNFDLSQHIELLFTFDNLDKKFYLRALTHGGLYLSSFNSFLCLHFTNLITNR